MSGIEVLQSGAKDDPEVRDRFLIRLALDAERMTRLTQSLLTLARVEAAGERDPTQVVDAPSRRRRRPSGSRPPRAWSSALRSNPT